MRLGRAVHCKRRNVLQRQAPGSLDVLAEKSNRSIGVTRDRGAGEFPVFFGDVSLVEEGIGPAPIEFAASEERVTQVQQ